MKNILFIAAILIFSSLSCFNGINDAYDAKGGPVIIYIAGGSFQRDGTSTNISTVSSFYMSQTEVTRAQFVAVTGLADPSDTAVSSTLDCPVQKVSWYHALVYCNRLSMLEGRTPVYSISGSTDPSDWGAIPVSSNGTWNSVICNWSADGFRLPTEMEWMWAAMGGSSGSGYTSPVYLTGYSKLFAGSNGSNSIGNYVWYDQNSGVGGTSSAPLATHSVGIKLTNELGLCDMSGNVWEWCWDWVNSSGWPSYDTAINGTTQIDYQGTALGTLRIVRGGPYGSDFSNCTVARRYDANPGNVYISVGFRVVHR